MTGGTRPEEMLTEARSLWSGERPRAVELCQQALALARAEDKADLACQALNLIAEDLFFNDRGSAVVVAREALDLARRAGRHGDAAEALNMLADSERLEGRLDVALGLLGESVECARTAGNVAAEAGAVNALGAIAWHRGDIELAINWFNEALRLRERLGQDYDIAVASANLGLMYYEKGDLVTALELSRRSLGLREALSDHHGIGEVSLNLGLIYADLGDWEKSLESYFHALAENEVAKDLVNTALCYGNIGEAYLRRGKLARARENLERALGIAREAKARWAEADILGSLGEVWFASGDMGRAADLYAQDRAICLDIEDPRELAETLRRWAELDLALGDLASARVRIDEALGLATRAGIGKEEANIRRVHGEVLAAAGDLSGARVSLDVSRTILRPLGKNFELGCTLLSIGRLEAQAGEGGGLALAQARMIFENLGIPDKAAEAARLLGGRSAPETGADLLREMAELVCTETDPAGLCRRALRILTARLGLSGGAVSLRDGSVIREGEAAEAGVEAGSVTLALETPGGRHGTLILSGAVDAAKLGLPARLLALGLGQALSTPPADPPEVTTTDRFPGIIGAGTTLKELFDTVERVAPTRASVLVLGEHGTGKEIVARALHDHSDRSTGPFVAVNCAAIPETLLEAELFGIEKGTATGVTAREGKFETANGGTLLLDEIGDMTLALQAKMLRVLQERSFERVGGRSPVEVDVRIIAATNRNLEQAMAAGAFRSDLYYRLSVITLSLPPLRDRKPDIPALTAYFTGRFAREYGKPVRGVSDACLDCLLGWNWPGNVRELENVIERAVIMARTDVVGPDDLPSELRCPTAPKETLQDARRQAKARAAAEVEQTAVVAALENCAWNVSRAADKLDISRVQLYRIIKRYGLKRPRA